MARLHEYQGKHLLADAALLVPAGGAADSPASARAFAERLARPVVVKIQAWTTGRAAIGGVAFADTPAQAEQAAARLLQLRVGQFPVTHVLVEEKLDIAHELFVSLSVDDRARSPVLLLSAGGGSGVEERAAAVNRISCSVKTGPDDQALAAAVASTAIPAQHRPAVAQFCRKLFEIARSIDARSIEINPLAITRDGRLVAADCRITIDDYAVFRQPQLGIEIARELDHPPTALERAAYAFEQADHRGTFYFAQMNTAVKPGSKGLIGFHGAGGGGSMMAMDAITTEGFTVANFCDTSGNPPPAKVYLAARVILSQPGLIGYFGSGSGVANQEQFWSAYGLAKAFWELNLDIPAVIRLGGNSEDRAVDILQSACREANLPAIVEGYKKTDTPAKIARRFAELVADACANRATDRGSERSVLRNEWVPRPPRKPAFVGSPSAHQFAVKGGRVWIDFAAWKSHAAAIIARSAGLLKDDHGKPALTLDAEAFKAKDSEMIACEVECRRDGIDGLFVAVDAPGLDEVGLAKGGS
jgi:succinyl-CoA synthetase beta subunit